MRDQVEFDVEKGDEFLVETLAFLKKYVSQKAEKVMSLDSYAPCLFNEHCVETRMGKGFVMVKAPKLEKLSP